MKNSRGAIESDLQKSNPERVHGRAGTVSDAEATIRALADKLRAAESRADESEARLHAILHSATDYAILTTDEHGIVTSWNEGAWRILGWREEEIIGEDVRVIFTPGDRDAGVPEEEMRTASAKRRADDERWHVRKDGSRFWASGILMPLRSGASGFLKILRDRTEQKRTGTALYESEVLKAAILEAALDCIISIDHDSRIVEWNPAAERTFGYTHEVAIGRDVAELIIPPELRDRHHRGMAHYLATGEGPVLRQRIELEAIRADGSRFPVELAISPVEIGGKPHFTAYLRDITERRRAEQALRESEQRLRATYEHAFVGIAEVDANGRFLRVNDECSEITGYSREELLARSIADIIHPDDRNRDLEQFRRQMAGEIELYALEKRCIHKNGHTVWIEVSASRVDDARGRPLYGIRVIRDVTERKRAERQKQLLINELNHRVKNTLATVQSIAAQTLRNAPSPEQARQDLDARLIALARTHDVLTRESWEGARLREIVEQAVEPYCNEREDRLHLSGPEVRLSPRMALIFAMMLQELATNAVKYGALSIATGEVRITWALSGTSSAERLQLRWEEVGGPPVQPPSRRGFGSQLIGRILARQLNGEVEIDFAPSGVVCIVDASLG